MGLLNWFYGDGEPKGGYSVFSEEVVPDDPVETDEPFEVIDNACMLVAANELNGASEHRWRPEMTEHVKENHGVTDPALFEKHADVVFHGNCGVTCYDDGRLLIESGRGTYELEPRDKLIITYDTGPGRGHAVCIYAYEYDAYACTVNIEQIYTKR